MTKESASAWVANILKAGVMLLVLLGFCYTVFATKDNVRGIEKDQDRMWQSIDSINRKLDTLPADIAKALRRGDG